MISLSENNGSTDLLILSKLTKKVLEWRNENGEWEERYKGVTKTTKQLFGYWFNFDHVLEDGNFFSFYPHQQLALETYIYLIEILKVNDISDLFRKFWDDELARFYNGLPAPSTFPKYCFKMATGSGKTFIMMFLIVWSFFNYKFNEPIKDFVTNNFLIIAPNNIVFDRLKSDISPTQNPNSIFNSFPFIPKNWKNQFNINVIYKSELNKISAEATIYLTNVHQLYSKAESINTIIKKAGLIADSNFEIDKNELIDRSMPDNPLFNLITSGDSLMIMNDEAHHVHSEYLAWNRTLTNINKKLLERSNLKVISQIDFTATPRYQDEQARLFEHIIFDYPLSSAIKDGIVKFPKIGTLENVPNIETDDFGLQNQYQIQAGIKVREEYEEFLSNFEKKAVLFIMADNNKNADQVWNFIVNQYPNYDPHEVLLIHTIDRGNKKGELIDKEESELIEAARTIDNLENNYKIIVSVLMLKEGWDVRSVVAIVPLRSYQSQILVEQTLGRGLRKQFDKDQREELTVIEHSSFEPIIRRALSSEGMDEETYEMFKINAEDPKIPKSGAILVYPQVSKTELDLSIPVLSGGFFLETNVLNKFDWNSLPKSLMALGSIEIRDPKYYERTFGEDEVIRELDLDFVYYYNINQYLTYITKRIMKKLHISSSLDVFLPSLKKYLKKGFFDAVVDFSEETNMKKINHPLVIKKIYETFKDIISDLTIKEKDYQSLNQKYNVSETPKRYVTKKVISNKKSLFNYTEVDSSLEEEFSLYLDKEDHVVSFCKITPAMKFYLYYNQDGFLKRYLPDFFVRDADDQFYLVETKGEGFMDKKSTELKKQVAVNWTKKAGSNWTYLLVEEKFFKDVGKKISFQELVNELKEVE